MMLPTCNKSNRIFSFHTQKNHGLILATKSKALNYLSKTVIHMYAMESEIIIYRDIFISGMDIRLITKC